MTFIAILTTIVVVVVFMVIKMIIGLRSNGLSSILPKQVNVSPNNRPPTSPDDQPSSRCALFVTVILLEETPSELPLVSAIDERQPHTEPIEFQESHISAANATC